MVGHKSLNVRTCDRLVVDGWRYYRQYGGPEVLECVEVPDPKLAQNGVLIRVKAAALDPADLCLLKSPFLLRELMLRTATDTLRGDQSGASVAPPDLANMRAI